MAAHECGHAIQDAENYKPLVMRRKIVPIASIGSKAAFPIILFGIFLRLTGLLKIGVALFAVVVIFQLVTLPVEFDASSRACTIMESSGRFSSDELSAIKSVLTAAGLTYVATTLNSLIQLFRLLSMTRRR